MLERRKASRRTVFLDAGVGFRAKFRLRCLIHNVSERGAKLVFLKGTDVPDEFCLRISKGGIQIAYTVSVRWRRGRAIGVEFDHPLDSLLVPKLGLATA
jgi:hypothetical protein